ncbi:MAG: PAS domain-containing protein [Scytolyngbya sp. HA4215-MV1]|jgi:PAS domain S-box-containing protein|nr:PAS domain-containing protein [Scytolyngbya sp. HA4215-MV1]
MNSELAKADSQEDHSDINLLLEQMDVAIALFAQDDRLERFNSRFVQLWQLSTDWLHQQPTCHEIFASILIKGYWHQEQTQQFQQFINQRTTTSSVFHLLQTNDIQLNIKATSRANGGYLLVIHPSEYLPPSLLPDNLQTTQAQKKGLKFLLDLTAQIQSSDHMLEISQLILSYLVEELDALFGYIKLINGKAPHRQADPVANKISEQFLSTHTESEIQDLRFFLDSSIPDGQGTFWQVVDTDEPLFIDDYVNHPQAISTLSCLGGRKINIYPISGAHSVTIGVLMLVFPTQNDWQPSYQYEMAIVACRILGSVIERQQAIRREIEDRQQLENARKRSEQRIRLLESVVVHANDAVIITEAEPIEEPGPRILYVNEAFTQMTGYTAQEVLRFSPRILQGEKTAPEARQKIRSALQTWQPVLVELINYRKDGTEFWVELSIVPVADDSGWYTHWIAIQRDITERKQLEAKLLKTLQREKELSGLKSRFIANTSHEFRTPLSTILSASELLEYYSHKLSEDERLEQLHLIQSCVDHINRLLEDVLLFGTAEAGRVQVEPIEVDLEYFCRNLTYEMQIGLGNQHRIEFVSQFPSRLTYLDSKLFRQIFMNLLSNAIKYSHPHTNIEIDLLNPDNEIILQVKDQGIGIPPPDLPHVFESFHRAANVDTIPGNGLGLSIVKQCVELMGGSISLHSQLGTGTTFVVKLPFTYVSQKVDLEKVFWAGDL